MPSSVHTCRGHPRTSAEAGRSCRMQYLAHSALVSALQAIFVCFPHNSPSSILRLPSTHVVDARGRPRKLTEAIFTPPSPGFCQLGHFCLFFLKFSHLPPSIFRPHMARMSAEADGSWREQYLAHPALVSAIYAISFCFLIIPHHPSSVHICRGRPQTSAEAGGS